MKIFSKQARLSRRIIVAFVVMAAVISALFSVGVIVAVRVLEEQLLTDSLHGDLTVAMARYSAGRELELLPGTRFYHTTDGIADELSDPPKWLGNLDTGFHEVFREGQAFHALVYEQGNEKFLYLRDQTDFERREHVLFLVVAAGFLLSVFAAWVLGYLLARRIMFPVARLAREVRHREQLLMLAPALAHDYADDEVGQLAVAFDATLDKLRQALERERFFTSDVSHELRTPLTVIATSCELLSAANTLNPKQQQQLQRIQRAMQEMRELIHTFLQLARDNLSDETVAERATLAAMADEQLKEWGAAAEAKQLQLQFTKEGIPPEKLFNIALLRAVVSNLLRNAVHYTDKGFVRLVLTSTGFRVEDSGQNIAPEQQETIFQPFVRGSGARGEGLGLGLSLVRRVCIHEGWRIQLYNLPRGGNCFEVALV